MLRSFPHLKTAILFVLITTAFTSRCDDNTMVLPYDEAMNSDTAINPDDATIGAPLQEAPAQENQILQQDMQQNFINTANGPQDSDSPFAEVVLNPTSFRAAKISHSNLIIALTQQEVRDADGNVTGGDINSGIMREVEQGVLSNVTQNFSAPDDPSKIAFIRLNVTKNAWIWDYFNDGTSTQSVNQQNGTPQYLFFNKGNLTSVLIGNRDDSAFANWVRTNSSTPFQAVEQAMQETDQENASIPQDLAQADPMQQDDLEQTDVQYNEIEPQEMSATDQAYTEIPVDSDISASDDTTIIQ